MNPAARPLTIAASLVLVLLLASAVVAQERVTLAAADGQPLVGTFRAPKTTPTGGVLLLPARGSTRTAFDALVERMKDGPLAVLALDPRGHGESAKTKDGVPIATGKDYDRDPARDPFALAERDVAAGRAFLIARKAPPGRLGVVAAGVTGRHALAALKAEEFRVAVLLTPDAEGTGQDPLAAAEGLKARPLFALATAGDATRGFDGLKARLAYPEAEFRVVEAPLAHGANMFGKVPGLEAQLAQWLADKVAAPETLRVPLAPLVVIDGDPSAAEFVGATTVDVPCGPPPSDGAPAPTAKVRLTRTQRTLDVGFRIPERYIRLNEIVVYVDASGEGPRSPDARCHAVSYSPQNQARKPVLVRRGGLRGYEDTDDKGVVAFARVGDKSSWTAELSLDLERFLGGPAPRSVRLAFEIRGQRQGEVRYWPDVAQVPTAPRTWASATLD